MIERTRDRLWRVCLKICFVAGVLLAAAEPNQAGAFNTDPVWAADKAANRTLALVRARATARRAAFLTGPYRPGPHGRAMAPDELVTGSTGGAAQLGDIIITPTSVSWKMDGLKPQLVVLLAQVQQRFGRPLHIVSGCRSKAHNNKVDGAKRSQHLHCNAVDFEIADVSKHVLADYLKQLPGRGGVGLYCRSSYVHLDIGPKRDWHWRCKKRKVVKKRKARRKHASVKRATKKKAKVKRVSAKKATVKKKKVKQARLRHTGAKEEVVQRKPFKQSSTKRRALVIKKDR